MSQKQSSLIVKFGLLIGVIMALVFIILTTFLTVRDIGAGEADFKKESATETALLAFAMVPQVHNFDKDTANAVAEKYLVAEENLRVKITTYDGEVFIDKTKENLPPSAHIESVELKNGENNLGVLETTHDPRYWQEGIVASVFFQAAFNIGGLIVLLILLVIFLRVLILKPLKTIGDVASDIAGGGGDLTKRIPVTNNDELGNLARNFNLFLDKMKNLAGEIKKSLSGTLTIKDNLFSNTQETSASLVQITSNLEGMRKQIQNLDSQILSAGSAVEEISANISSMGTLIDRQSQSVSDSTSAVNEMVASINSVAAITETKRRSTEKLLTVTKTGGEKLKQTTLTVTEIAGNLGNISNLIKIINSIAAQTNLLAMNAAIEAAHAGDAGRGFSVVADEIRKLAEGSSVNAKNIGSIIKTIVLKISEASSFANETGQAFEVLAQEVQDVSSAFAEIAASTQELSTGGAQIIQSMTQLSDISSSVRSGSDEMESGAKSMATDMQVVRRISTEVLSGMSEIETGTNGIAHAVNSIHTYAQDLDTSTEKLKKEISEFKTENQ